MIQQSSSELTLRPIPGPEPVPLPDNTIWFWLIPVVLIGFLWFWWSRKVRRVPVDPQDQLYLAMTYAAEQGVPTQARLAELNQALRQYLASKGDSAWLTATGNDTEPLWNTLLADNPPLATTWFARWLAGEEYQFGRTTLSEEQLSSYIQAVEELDDYLMRNMKKG